MKALPPLEILDGTYLQVPGQDMALHARVRRVLKSAIDDHFDDGQHVATADSGLYTLQDENLALSGNPRVQDKQSGLTVTGNTVSLPFR